MATVLGCAGASATLEIFPGNLSAELGHQDSFKALMTC